MVSYKEIQASNALINDATAPRVAVFVGGTSGIGKLTIRALVGTGASVRIYLVGRSSSKEPSNAFIEEMRTLNTKAEILWTEGEISLLAEAKRICEIVKGKESFVDLLFLSAGYAPFGARKDTIEGIEITQSLEYYSRILFILQLLPLLEQGRAARVISVLAGGMERATMKVDDLDLRQPGNFNGINAQGHYGAMNTMTLDKLASNHPNVTFMHSWPGFVNTGNARRSPDPKTITAWLFWLILEPLVFLLAFSDNEAGQRHLFQCTSAAFGGRGVSWSGKAGVNTLQKHEDGMFLVNYRCDCTPNAKVIPVLREMAQQKIWDHTQEVLGPYQ